MTCETLPRQLAKGSTAGVQCDDDEQERHLARHDARIAAQRTSRALQKWREQMAGGCKTGCDAAGRPAPREARTPRFFGGMYGYHDDRVEVEYGAGGGRRGGGGGGARFAPYERSGGRGGGGGGGDRVLVPTKCFVTNLAYQTSWQNLKVMIVACNSTRCSKSYFLPRFLSFKISCLHADLMCLQLIDVFLSCFCAAGPLPSGEQTLKAPREHILRHLSPRGPSTARV